MTDEEAFQAALDVNPDEHTIRLVFADFLEERGDPRAEGYRALGMLGKTPRFNRRTGYWHYWIHDYTMPSHLPNDWWHWFNDRHPSVTSCSRREADDAAARAFSQLPESRRAELLGTLTPA